MDTGQSGEVAVSVEVLSQPDWVAFAALVVAVVALLLTGWQILRNEWMQPADGANVTRRLAHEDGKYEYWIVSIRLSGPAVLHEVTMLLVGADFVASSPAVRPRMDCGSKPMTAMIRVKKGVSPSVGLGWYKDALIGNRPVAKAVLRTLRSDNSEDAYRKWSWGFPQLGSPKKVQSWGRWKKLNRGIFRSKGGLPDKAGLPPIDIVKKFPPELLAYTQEWSDFASAFAKAGTENLPVPDLFQTGVPDDGGFPEPGSSDPGASQEESQRPSGPQSQ